MASSGASIDVLNFLLPSPGWAADFHLAVAGAGGQPTYTWLDVANARVWVMKGSGGYPWDWFTYDANYLYQGGTSIDSPLVPGGPTSWTQPTMFKPWASASWPGANGGVAWLPRTVQIGGVNSPLFTPDSTYRLYSACGEYTASSLNGPIECSAEGPYLLNFGGGLGLQSALAMSYKWGWQLGSGFATMERNYYVQGFGLVQWETYALANGQYGSASKTVAFNTQVAGGTPVLTFPCGVPTI